MNSPGEEKKMQIPDTFIQYAIHRDTWSHINIERVRASTRWDAVAAAASDVALQKIYFQRALTVEWI